MLDGECVKSEIYGFNWLFWMICAIIKVQGVIFSVFTCVQWLVPSSSISTWVSQLVRVHVRFAHF